MPLTLQQQLGEILDSDYKQRKWSIIKQFRECGEIVRATEQVQLTEVVDSCGKTFCPVPPGPFVYGPNNEYGETKATYYCSKYPVTELEFLDPETKEVMVETPVLNKDQDVDPLDEFSSTGGDVSTADNTPLTHAAFAVWCLLLLSLIGLACWKYFT